LEFIYSMLSIKIDSEAFKIEVKNYNLKPFHYAIT